MWHRHKWLAAAVKTMECVVPTAMTEYTGKFAEGVARRYTRVLFRCTKCGDVKVKDADEVVQNWVKIKAQEKAGKADRSILAGVPAGAPALIQAQRLGEKAARVGFDWTSATEVFKKVEEETHELAATLADHTSERQEHELGDLLFALTSLARHLNIDSETALRKAGQRFNTRFRFIEHQLERNGEDIHHTSLTRLEELWQAAKQTIG